LLYPLSYEGKYTPAISRPTQRLLPSIAGCLAHFRGSCLIALGSAARSVSAAAVGSSDPPGLCRAAHGPRAVCGCGRCNTAKQPPRPVGRRFAALALRRPTRQRHDRPGRQPPPPTASGFGAMRPSLLGLPCPARSGRRYRAARADRRPSCSAPVARRSRRPAHQQSPAGNRPPAIARRESRTGHRAVPGALEPFRQGQPRLILRARR
jgi:hypothetical protein